MKNTYEVNFKTLKITLHIYIYIYIYIYINCIVVTYSIQYNTNVYIIIQDVHININLIYIFYHILVCKMILHTICCTNCLNYMIYAVNCTIYAIPLYNDQRKMYSV